MTLQLWEVVLVIGIVCFAALIVQLIILLRRVTDIVVQNKDKIASILSHADEISADAAHMTDKVSGTVDGIDRIVGAVRSESAPETALALKKAFDFAGTALGTFRMFKRRKQQKEIDELLKEARKKKK